MSDKLALRALRERDGIDVPDGSLLYVQHVHEDIYRREETLLAHIKVAMRWEVVRSGQEHGHELTEDDVQLHALSPAEMHTAWRKHSPMDPPPPRTWHTLVAYWTPLPRTGDRVMAGQLVGRVSESSRPLCALAGAPRADGEPS